MTFLLDTTILIRLASSRDPLHGITQTAVSNLGSAGERLILAPQCIYEFWAVASRPTNVRGLGMQPKRIASEVSRLTLLFNLQPDPADLYSEWLRLVTSYHVSGKESHDARLVAFMNLAGIDQILTFNATDFARYRSVTPRDPKEI